MGLSGKLRICFAAHNRHVLPMHKILSMAVFITLFASAAGAQQIGLGSGSVVATVQQLKPGEYIWTPQVAPEGPLMMIVNIENQRAMLYRNGIPIGATTVSTGRPGHATPTGVFTVLEKAIEHHSSTYDNAPMPYMQRLTWYGVALHAGRLPGFPASHGCIRLPAGFAKLLYGVTFRGMTVIISGGGAAPRIAPSPMGAVSSAEVGEQVSWHPELSLVGPVSIIVSVADGRAIVLRNGKVIGSAPVALTAKVDGTSVFELQAGEGSARWIRVALSAKETDRPAPAQQWAGFETDPHFRQMVASIVKPGTVVIVTSDSMKSDPSTSRVIIESPAPVVTSPATVTETPANLRLR